MPTIILIFFARDKLAEEMKVLGKIGAAVADRVRIH